MENAGTLLVINTPVPIRDLQVPLACTGITTLTIRLFGGYTLRAETVSCKSTCVEYREDFTLMVVTFVDHFRYIDVSLTVDDRSERIIPRLVGLIPPSAGQILVPFGHDMRPLLSPLEFHFNFKAHDEGGSANRAVAALTSGSVSPQARVWKGPALVLKFGDRRMQTYVDIADSDLRDVQSFFVYW